MAYDPYIPEYVIALEELRKNPPPPEPPKAEAPEPMAAPKRKSDGYSTPQPASKPEPIIMAVKKNADNSDYVLRSMVERADSVRQRVYAPAPKSETLTAPQALLKGLGLLWKELKGSIPKINIVVKK